MPRPLLRVLAATAAATLALTACSTTSSGSDSRSAGSTGATPAAAGAFPVTMTHAFGSTTITTAPTRVVTLGWGVADAALAVGVDPVAMDYQPYGTQDGAASWVRAKVEAMGVPLPTILPKTTDEPAYDAIVKARPDVILAVASGITAKQYTLLSDIAPTVAYTGKPYTTSWQDVIRQTARALGRSARANTVLTGIGNQLRAQGAAHPELKGKTVAAVWDVGGTFYVYRRTDARVGFMFDLGLTNAPSVDRLANGSESFYYTLSYEKVPQISSDILVTYADTPALLATFLGKSYARAIPAVRRGAVASLVGTARIAAVSPPTALSFSTALPELVDALSAAAKKAAPTD